MTGEYKYSYLCSLVPPGGRWGGGGGEFPARRRGGGAGQQLGVFPGGNMLVTLGVEYEEEE